MAKRGPKPKYLEGTRWLTLPLPLVWARHHLPGNDRAAIEELLALIRAARPDGWPGAEGPKAEG